MRSVLGLLDYLGNNMSNSNCYLGSHCETLKGKAIFVNRYFVDANPTLDAPHVYHHCRLCTKCMYSGEQGRMVHTYKLLTRIGKIDLCLVKS